MVTPMLSFRTSLILYFPLVTVCSEQELVKDCGASEFVYTVLDIFKNTIQAKIVVCSRQYSIHMVQFKNKTATRLPETIHIDFNPLMYLVVILYDGIVILMIRTVMATT